MVCYAPVPNPQLSEKNPASNAKGQELSMPSASTAALEPHAVVRGRKAFLLQINKSLPFWAHLFFGSRMATQAQAGVAALSLEELPVSSARERPPLVIHTSGGGALPARQHPRITCSIVDPPVTCPRACQPACSLPCPIPIETLHSHSHNLMVDFPSFTADFSIKPTYQYGKRETEIWIRDLALLETFS